MKFIPYAQLPSSIKFTKTNKIHRNFSFWIYRIYSMFISNKLFTYFSINIFFLLHDYALKTLAQIHFHAFLCFFLQIFQFLQQNNLKIGEMISIQRSQYAIKMALWTYFCCRHKLMCKSCVHVINVGHQFFWFGSSNVFDFLVTGIVKLFCSTLQQTYKLYCNCWSNENLVDRITYHFYWWQLHQRYQFSRTDITQSCR